MYKNKPVSAWPQLTINWSLEPETWCYSFDGERPDWASGEELILGRAQMAEVHGHLVFNSKISNSNEFWEGAAGDKAEEVIHLWQSGTFLSPPVFMLWEDNTTMRICLAGGNHRFNISYLSGEMEIPFLAIPAHKKGLENMLTTVAWL